MPSDWEPGQEAVVAGASGMHVLGCGDQLQVPVWWQGKVADTQRWARAHDRLTAAADPGCPCVSPLAAQSSPRCVHSMCIKQAACKCTVCVWQREASQVVHACVWYSRTTEAWTGCQCCSRALAGGGWRVRSRKGGIRLVGISECKSMSGESWEICRGSQSCASSWFCPGWSRSL